MVEVLRILREQKTQDDAFRRGRRRRRDELAGDVVNLVESSISTKRWRNGWDLVSGAENQGFLVIAKFFLYPEKVLKI